LAPEVLKKLENNESGRSLLLEKIEDLSQAKKIEELSQAIARLTAEGRSTRELFISMLQSVWESISQRGARTSDALENILQHAVEMSRHDDLRGFAEKLEALVRVPDMMDPRQTLLSFGVPKHTSAAPKPTPNPGVDSKKRGAEDDLEVGPKRRKVHDS
jgi:hypothetical protein